MVVVWIVCVVVVVDAYTPWSPELPSDLEDSDNLFTGSAKVDEASSPYAGGKFPCVTGLSGSSKVTLALLPDGAVSDMVFLLSFLSFLVSFAGASRGISVENFPRPGNLTLDFFFVGWALLISIVGAVVIISGAMMCY